MRIKEALMGRTKNLTSSSSLSSTRFSLKASLVFCVWAMIRQAMTQAIESWSFLHGKVFAISAVVLFLFLVGANSAYSQQNSPSEAVLRGYVDSVVVNGNRVIAQGWVGVTDSSHKVVSLSIWFANTQVYEGRFERIERPDVVKETGRNDWLKSGWRIDASSPSDLKSGEYPVKVLAKRNCFPPPDF
jgi:hypothetical protein